jgi:hypothetical protein
MVGWILTIIVLAGKNQKKWMLGLINVVMLNICEVGREVDRILRGCGRMMEVTVGISRGKR